MAKRHRKVLLVSASVGNGHMQAARAIQTAWKDSFPDDTVIVVDFMDERRSLFNYALKESYLKMIEYTPFLYDALYRISHGFQPEPRLQQAFSWLLKSAMLQLLAHYRPEAVICTHPFPCAAMAFLKRRRKAKALLAGVVTDFAVHSTWIYPEVDVYSVAAPDLRDEMVSAGIAARKVHVTGIPIQPTSVRNQEELYKKWSLCPDLPVVLLMGGGLGNGPMRKVVLKLDAVGLPFQMVIAAGGNTELKNELSLMANRMSHPATVLGFDPQVRDLIAFSHLLITKPGALTLSEGLAAGVPMLLYEAIGGQETDNAAFLVRQGAAAWVTEFDAAAIAQLVINSIERQCMVQTINQLACPDSAQAAVMAIAARLDPVNQAVGI